jgi:integrase
MPRRVVGIRRKGAGWQAYVRVAGVLHTKQYAADEPIANMRAWRETQINKFGGRRNRTGSLAADVEAFLKKPEIAAQPYVKQTARHLALWMTALGPDKPRGLITRDEIEAEIQRWLTKYAEPTVYHRRSALLQLYTVLDGPAAENPVRATTCPKAWIPADHSVPFAVLEQIVEAMPDWRYVRKGITQPSIAKLVARVIIEVGLRPVDLQKIRRSDINWTAATLRWPASSKGKGTHPRTVPLTDEGLEAFRAYDAANAYGAFVQAAVSRSFKRAAKRVDGKHTRIHLYSGRHTLGADLYRQTGDLATVGRMLNHAPNSHATPQYAQGANADVDRAAAIAVSRGRQVQSLSTELPEKLPTVAKPHALRKIR